MEERVQLHLYDVTKGFAKKLSPILIGKQVDGLYHAGVVVGGVEYTYGPRIWRTFPGQTVFGTPDSVVDLGLTTLAAPLREEFLSEAATRYNPDTFDVLFHNSVTFSNEFCNLLTGHGIPAEVQNQTDDFVNSPTIAQLLEAFGSLQAGDSAGPYADPHDAFRQLLQNTFGYPVPPAAWTAPNWMGQGPFSANYGSASFGNGPFPPVPSFGSQFPTGPGFGSPFSMGPGFMGPGDGPCGMRGGFMGGRGCPMMGPWGRGPMGCGRMGRGGGRWAGCGPAGRHGCGFGFGPAAAAAAGSPEAQGAASGSAEGEAAGPGPAGRHGMGRGGCWRGRGRGGMGRGCGRHWGRMQTSGPGPEAGHLGTPSAAGPSTSAAAEAAGNSDAAWEAAQQMSHGPGGEPLPMDSQARTIHFGVTCDVCNCYPLIGVRYKSAVLPDWDACANCANTEAAKNAAPFLEYGCGDNKLPTDEEGRTIHLGVSCDVCGVAPIVGVRFKSATKRNWDACPRCAKTEAAAAAAPFLESGSAGVTAAAEPRQDDVATPVVEQDVPPVPPAVADVLDSLPAPPTTEAVLPVAPPAPEETVTASPLVAAALGVPAADTSASAVTSESDLLGDLLEEVLPQEEKPAVTAPDAEMASSLMVAFAGDGMAGLAPAAVAAAPAAKDGKPEEAEPEEKAAPVVVDVNVGSADVAPEGAVAPAAPATGERSPEAEWTSVTEQQETLEREDSATRGWASTLLNALAGKK